MQNGEVFKAIPHFAKLSEKEQLQILSTIGEKQGLLNALINIGWTVENFESLSRPVQIKVLELATANTRFAKRLQLGVIFAKADPSLQEPILTLAQSDEELLLHFSFEVGANLQRVDEQGKEKALAVIDKFKNAKKMFAFGVGAGLNDFDEKTRQFASSLANSDDIFGAGLGYSVGKKIASGEKGNYAEISLSASGHFARAIASGVIDGLRSLKDAVCLFEIASRNPELARELGLATAAQIKIKKLGKHQAKELIESVSRIKDFALGLCEGMTNAEINAMDLLSADELATAYGKDPELLECLAKNLVTAKGISDQQWEKILRTFNAEPAFADALLRAFQSMLYNLPTQTRAKIEKALKRTRDLGPAPRRTIGFG